MQLSECQSLIGSLTGDPSHDRYPLTDINIELDNTQDDWNLKARIIKATTTITIVDGTRQYALTTLTGTPLAITRATHKGLHLDKRSKTWLDLYSGVDWTAQTGTPTVIVIEEEDPAIQYVDFYPTPLSNDAGANAVIEYVKRHTPMSAASDVPFMSGTSSNYLLRPYDWGVCYATAARLLLRDPNQTNSLKVYGVSPDKPGYLRIGENVLGEVIQMFKSFEKEEPPRFRGGRNWNSGEIRYSK
jgi:hypothetical protein